METFAIERRVVPEVLEAAWKRVVDGWDVVAEHDELLRLVSQHDAYAWAAGQYRGRGNDAIAVRQLDRLRRAAEATLLVGATKPIDRTPTPYRTVMVMIVVLMVAAVAGLVFARMLQRDDPSTHTGSPPRSGTAPGSARQTPQSDEVR